MIRTYWILGIVCAFIGGAAGILWSPTIDEQLQEALPAPSTAEEFTTSDTCLACHPGPYDSWYNSYHRTMTQVATPRTVLGTFTDTILENRGYQWRLERRGDEFWVTMPDPLWFTRPAWFMQLFEDDWPHEPPQIEARIVMTTGSHHMQNYWIRRPELGEGPGPNSGALVQLPWVWLISEGRWVPTQDSFVRPPSSSVQAAEIWNANCSQCHSVGTEPRVLDHVGRFDTRTVELGITCEACHGPAEEHVRLYRSPLRRYLRYFRELREDDPPDPTIVHPAKLDPRRSVATCAQCHSFGEWTDQQAYRTSGVPFRPGDELDTYRHLFRYGDPLLLQMQRGNPLAVEANFWRDGTIRVAGREYNGLLEDAHFTESDLTCLSCHSMHDYEAPADQLAPDLTGNRSCLNCHGDFAGEIAEHSRHRPESTGSECMNCHMPHTTYGLFSAIRSHRIDNPSVRVSVESGRPNACNLCHLDRTLEWSSRYLNEWYGQPLVELDQDERSIAASILWMLKGDAAQRTILAWHLGWEAAREASGGAWMAPYLAHLLTDPYSATRQVAYRALIGLPGFQAFDYDYLAPRSELTRKATEATERWLGLGGPDRAGPHLLMAENGEFAIDEWLRLLAERDQTPLAIVE